MAEILLRELSNTDLDWLMVVGKHQEFPAEAVILQFAEDSNLLHLLLAGSLSICIPHSRVNEIGILSSSEDREQREIVRLTEGDIVGEGLLFKLPPLVASVEAREDSVVLSIPRSQLAEKLREDTCFSTHLHRAIALIVAERLRRVLEMPSWFQFISDQPVKEAIVVFGEMRDSDVDWLVRVGSIEKIELNQVLVQPGRPLDALYIILDGILSLTVSEGYFNPLTHCFQCTQSIGNSERVIHYLSRGEMSGTINLLDFRPSPITVKAVKESLVLSIPRQQLMLKLQQDWGFASRFYRVLAVQLVETWQTVVERLSNSERINHSNSNINEAIENEDELNFDLLHQLSQGSARFNWLLKQLGVL